LSEESVYIRKQKPYDVENLIYNQDAIFQSKRNH